MVTIVTRSGKGSALTNTEIDTNFTNLNTGKVEDVTARATYLPSLVLDFANGKSLDPRVSFARSSTATYYDGVTVSMAEQNLLLQSQALLANGWSASNGYVGSLGSELISNGTFDSNIAGWSNVSSGTGTVGWDGGTIKLTTVTDWQNRAAASTPITTIVGRYYVAMGTVTAAVGGTGDVGLKAGTSPGSQQNLYIGAYPGGVGTRQAAVFLATATTTYISLLAQFSAGSVNFDDISVKEVSADNVVAPDSTSTAATATAVAPNATFTQSVSLGAASYTFSVWLKRTTGTGNVDITCDSAGTWVTQTITSSWARYTVTQTLAAGTRTPGIRIATSGDQVQVWGAQLEQRSSATAYTPTNTPIASGIELVTNGGPFVNTTGWTGLNSTLSVVSGALRVTENGVSPNPYAQQSFAVTSGKWYKITFDLVTLNAQKIRVWVGSTYGSANWLNSPDITTTGTKTIYFLASGNTAYFEFVGYATAGGTSEYYDVNYISVQEITSYTAGPITNYVPQLLTAAANTPRFHHDPVTGESLGLLIEEQRTNLLTYSEQFDNAAWAIARLNTTGTPPWINVTAAPDGTNTADKIIEDTSVSNSHYIYQSQTLNATSYLISVYAKAAERSRFLIRESVGGTIVSYDLTGNGSILSGTGGTITPVGNGWFRCTRTWTATAVSTSLWFMLLPNNGTVYADGFYTGDGTSGIYVWGAQLEAGSFATSYIPTVASQVTRNADSASMTGTAFSSWYNPSEGTLALSGSYALQNGVTNFNVGISGNASINSVSRDFRFLVNGTNVGFNNAGATDAVYSFNVIGAYKTSDFATTLNGAAVTTNTSAVIAPGTSFAISPNKNGGYIRKFVYYPKRLTDADLQSLTA